MRTYLSLLALLLSRQAFAQLLVGSSGMAVLSGTTPAVDGLALTPTSNLTIASNSLQRTTTPLANNPSINRLYQFSSPLLYSGKVQLNYLTSELNGYSTPTLQIAYAPAAITNLTVTTSSTITTTTYTVSNTLTSQSLFVVTATALSDLTPLLYTRPSTVAVVVDVLELNDVTTQGAFQVKITRDPAVNLGFDSSLTSLNGHSVQNQAWQFDNSDETYHVLTATQIITGSDQLSFGPTGVLNPNSTTGVLTVGASVIDRGLVERKLGNNTDADKIDYFQR